MFGYKSESDIYRKCLVSSWFHLIEIVFNVLINYDLLNVEKAMVEEGGSMYKITGRGTIYLD